MSESPVVINPEQIEIVEATQLNAPINVTAELELSAVDQLLLKFTPGEVTVQARVNEGEIASVFNELDVDRSGALDREELRAFLQGRYNMSNESCDRVFLKFDKDHNSTIDVNEFAAIVEKINSIAWKYDEQEVNAFRAYVQKYSFISLFMICCCPCTVGLSCCIGGCCINCLAQGIAERAKTSNDRLKCAIDKGLTVQSMRR